MYWKTDIHVLVPLIALTFAFPMVAGVLCVIFVAHTSIVRLPANLCLHTHILVRDCRIGCTMSVYSSRYYKNDKNTVDSLVHYALTVCRVHLQT